MKNTDVVLKKKITVWLRVEEAGEEAGQGAEVIEQ
jgi:hypothetical protein